MIFLVCGCDRVVVRVWCGVKMSFYPKCPPVFAGLGIFPLVLYTYVSEDKCCGMVLYVFYMIKIICEKSSTKSNGCILHTVNFI